jgi:hypothetical protein
MTNRNYQKARMCHLVVLVVVLVTPAPARALLPGINYPPQPDSGFLRICAIAALCHTTEAISAFSCSM